MQCDFFLNAIIFKQKLISAKHDSYDRYDRYDLAVYANEMHTK